MKRWRRGCRTRECMCPIAVGHRGLQFLFLFDSFVLFLVWFGLVFGCFSLVGICTQLRMKLFKTQHRSQQNKASLLPPQPLKFLPWPQRQELELAFESPQKKDLHFQLLPTTLGWMKARPGQELQGFRETTGTYMWSEPSMDCLILKNKQTKHSIINGLFLETEKHQGRKYVHTVVGSHAGWYGTTRSLAGVPWLSKPQGLLLSLRKPYLVPWAPRRAEMKLLGIKLNVTLALWPSSHTVPDESPGSDSLI